MDMPSAFRNFSVIAYMLASFVVVSCGGGGSGSQDTTVPVIKLIGANPQVLELGSVYVELGAVAQDDKDGDISAKIRIDTSQVDMNGLGSYLVRYSVKDTSGNEGESATREIRVEDTVAPVAKVVFPPQSSLTEADSIKIRGVAADIDGVAAIKVNGVDVITSDDYENWSIDFPLSRGLTNFDISTTDLLGNTTTSVSEFSITSRYQIKRPTGVIVDTDKSQLYILNSTSSSILKRDLISGEVTVLSDRNIPDTINQLSYPEGFALDSANKRILVADSSNSAVVAVDLSTGKRTILSNNITPNSVNGFMRPIGIAMDSANNRAIVIDSDFPVTVLAVDLDTGVRTILSSGTLTSAEPLLFASSIMIDSVNDRALVVSDSSIVAVDLSTGVRSVFSGYNVPNTNNQFLGSISPLVIDNANNRALAVSNDRVMSIDLTTGARTIIVDHSSSGFDGSPSGLAYVAADNELYMVDYRLSSLSVTNIVDGNRVFSQGNNTPNMNNLMSFPEAIIVDNNKRALVLDSSLGALFSVDLNNGSREIISDNKTLSTVGFLEGARSMAIDIDGNQVFVLNPRAKSVVRVNLGTGEQGVLSSSVIPNSNNKFSLPVSIALDKRNNRLLVTDSILKAVIAVDIATGERTILSGAGVPDAVNELVNPQLIVMNPSKNRALLSDGISRTIIAVDLDTGARTVFSGAGVSSPIGVFYPTTLTIDEKNNRLLAIDRQFLKAVDLNSGTTTILLDLGLIYDVNPILYANGLSLHGDIAVIAVGTLNAIVSVDLVTGEKVFLSK